MSQQQWQPQSQPEQPSLQALIMDEGELADVREAFASMGLRYASREDYRPGGEVPLLVTTPAEARRIRGEAQRHKAPPHHLHVVVGDPEGESLDSVPCDFLLQRPVSREVLRLLAERASYEGPERRRVTRVALGAEVTIRNGSWEQLAVLAQISVGGAGLVTGFPLESGTQVQIELPRNLTTPRRLVLDGEVLSARRVTTVDGDSYDVSIAFDTLPLSDRVTVRALMAGQPIDFRPFSDATAAMAAGAPRRGARRRPIGGRNGVARVVIGRDLSQTGMRIEFDPGLSGGQKIQLALYGGGSSESVIVSGHTERDPQQEGWHVHFVDLDEAAARGIEELRNGSSMGGPGFVIAEILEH